MAVITEPIRRARRDCLRRLGVWLKQREISQSDAAKRLGLHRGHLSNLIAGKHIASDGIVVDVEALMSEPDASAPVVERSKLLFDLNNEPIDIPEDSAPEARPIRKVRPVRSPRATPLQPEAMAAVVSIVRVIIDMEPEMAAERLVAVTRAASDGFRLQID